MLETSASLLSGLRKNDEPGLYNDCWERFVDQYTPLIYSWSRQIGLQHQNAEEITQELMCRLVRTLRNYHYDKTQKFRSWLFVCTRNVIYQFWKDQAKRKSDQLFDLNEVGQRQSLIEFLNENYDREFEIEARQRVQQKVGDRDWKVFLSLTETPQDANSVAKENALSVDNVYQIKSRVVALLKRELDRLQQAGIDP